MQAPLVPAAVTGTTDPSLTARLNTHLNCASVDDSGIILKTYHKMLHMKYPNAEGSVVLGKTHDEIGASVDVLMGRKTQELVHIADKKPIDLPTLRKDVQTAGRGQGQNCSTPHAF